MSVVAVGDIYINPDKLAGLSDVTQTPSPEGVPSSYSFQIYLEGAQTSVVFSDKAQADAAHDKLVSALSPAFRFASGGETIAYTAVNSIGVVGSDPRIIDKDSGLFNVSMDGVTVGFLYPTIDQANAARAELIKKLGG